jgi:hypothetical protein
MDDFVYYLVSNLSENTQFKPALKGCSNTWETSSKLIHTLLMNSLKMEVCTITVWTVLCT